MTPEEVSGVTESFPDDAEKLSTLYLVLIVVLGTALLFGLVAWFIMAMNGRALPEGMAVLVGSIGGGLVGILTSPGKSQQ